MCIEPNKNKIESGQYFFNLIHSDISGISIQNYRGAQNYVIFVDNYNNILEIIILASKYRALAIFDLF